MGPADSERPPGLFFCIYSSFSLGTSLPACKFATAFKTYLGTKLCNLEYLLLIYFYQCMPWLCVHACTHSFTEFIGSSNNGPAIMCLSRHSKAYPSIYSPSVFFQKSNMNISQSRNQVPSTQPTQIANASWQPFSVHLLDSHTLILRWIRLLSGSLGHTSYPTEQWIPWGTTSSVSELWVSKAISNINTHTSLCSKLKKGPHKEVCVLELCLYMFKHQAVHTKKYQEVPIYFLPSNEFWKVTSKPHKSNTLKSLTY